MIQKVTIRFVQLPVIFVGVLIYLAIIGNAQEVTGQLNLTEKKEFVQFVVEGPGDNFEVDLLLPDGTKLTSENADETKYLYFPLTDKRIWLLYEANQGKYQLIVKSELVNPEFKFYIKEEIKKPVTIWEEPINQTIAIENSNPIKLKWSVEGDVRQNAKQLKIYLQNKEGWERMLIQETSLYDGFYALDIPLNVPDGEYQLLLEADNRTMEPQLIDPKVNIIVKRGFIPPSPKIVESKIINGGLFIKLRIPKDTDWLGLTTKILNESNSSEPIIINVTKENLVFVEEESEGENEVYELHVIDFQESGIYSGYVQTILNNNILGGIITIPALEYQIRDWDKDKISWSIEDDFTNKKFVEVAFEFQSNTRVKIIDIQNPLFDSEVSISESPYVLKINLTEGEHSFQIFLNDDKGNSMHTSKRFLVDFTPPRLEMIQPLSGHTSLPGGFASGFTEPNNIIVINEVEYYPDENGYFRIDQIKDNLSLLIIDPSGNETVYYWEGINNFSSLWKLVLFNMLIVTTTIIIIIMIRKGRKDE